MNENNLSKLLKVKLCVISNSLDIEIIVVDERLSSLEAKKSLINQGIKTGHNKEDVDMTAAALFLQNYLNYLEK